eukprot:1160677-Pelagomonas_calceolata.AAC.15
MDPLELDESAPGSRRSSALGCFGSLRDIKFNRAQQEQQHSCSPCEGAGEDEEHNLCEWRGFGWHNQAELQTDQGIPHEGARGEREQGTAEQHVLEQNMPQGLQQNADQRGHHAGQRGLGSPGMPEQQQSHGGCNFGECEASPTSQMGPAILHTDQPVEVASYSNTTVAFEPGLEVGDRPLEPAAGLAEPQTLTVLHASLLGPGLTPEAIKDDGNKYVGRRIAVSKGEEAGYENAWQIPPHVFNASFGILVAFVASIKKAPMAGSSCILGLSSTWAAGRRHTRLGSVPSVLQMFGGAVSIQQSYNPLLHRVQALITVKARCTPCTLCLVSMVPGAVSIQQSYNSLLHRGLDHSEGTLYADACKPSAPAVPRLDLVRFIPICYQRYDGNTGPGKSAN